MKVIQKTGSGDNYMKITKSDIRIIAFDQSTTATGWAVLNQETAEIVDYGVLRPKGETNDRIIETVKKSLWLVEEYQASFVFIEGVQYQRNAVVLQVLAKLAGTLEIMLIEKGYFVNVVKASEWRRKVGVKGRKRADVKKSAIQLVKDIYDIKATEDECEAILFARAFCDI